MAEATGQATVCQQSDPREDTSCIESHAPEQCLAANGHVPGEIVITEVAEEHVTQVYGSATEEAGHAVQGLACSQPEAAGAKSCPFPNTHANLSTFIA